MAQAAVQAAAPAPADASIAAEGVRKFDLEPLRQQAFLAVQLALLALVIRQFDIESTAFLHICVLAFAGAVLQSVLPMSWRLPAFAALSLGGIGLVYGATQSAWLVGFGLVLIGICHLPLSHLARVALLVAAGIGLAALRVEIIEGPWSPAIWPILGSMFMFRTIVYMYDLRHEKEPRSWARTLAYFFMLPNVCFPMFPVVDYKAFKRTYYNAELWRIQQVGVEWIIRGVIQLILYRLVYYYLTLAPEEVTNPSDLGRFIVSNYLLYLRISGQFHVIVGILRLFGFNLPETHHRYLLASSINDFWRRINIYWKDFMMKIFYYPSVFALRKRGASERTALVIGTLVVFLSTWLLHSYQWFWLRGSFPLTWPDALFWGILGVLVVGNSLYESARGRARHLSKRAWSPGELTGVVLRTASTFAFISVLWSLWTTESISSWFGLWGSAFASGIDSDTVSTLAVGGGAAVAAAAANPPPARRAGPGRPAGGSSRFGRSALLTTAAILAVFLVGQPRFYKRLDPQIAKFVGSLREQKLNRQDAAMLERGYYENLVSVERFNSQLWELYSKRPVDWGNLRDSGAVRDTDDFLLEELIPSIELEHAGTTFHTNRWGMRDRDYTVAKPEGVRRIAVFGPSDAMGTGVEADETFSRVLENQLSSSGGEQEYQVLNFSVGNYTPVQHLRVLEQRAMPFSPDVAVLVGHDDDASRVVRHLRSTISREVDVPYPFLRDLLARSGVEKEMSVIEMRQRLDPMTEEATAWTYRRFAEICRENGILPIWVFLPFLVENVEAADPELLEYATSAGFVIVDLSRIYDGRDVESFRVFEWDHHHPTVEGHRMIGDRLAQVVRDHDRHAQAGLAD
jgi:D-alanyl-lipoteichoic acid acyltransferase DltB (MBOAT superfamily)